MDEPTGNQANLAMPQQVGLHVPRMYRVAFRLLADADKAHDAVQEACVKALAGMGRFNGRSALATWLHRITVNCAMDAIRSETRKDNAHQAHAKQVLHAAGVSWRPAFGPHGQAGHGVEAVSPACTPAQTFFSPSVTNTARSGFCNSPFKLWGMYARIGTPLG